MTIDDDVGRYYSLYRRNDKLEMDKSKYNQLLHNDVRISTDAPLRWASASSAAEPPQY